MLTTKAITYTLIYVSSANAFLALFELVDPFYFFMFSMMFIVGILLDIRGTHYPPRLLLNIVAIPLTLAFLLQLNFDNLVEPLASALLMLIGIKALEEKRVRDLYQILLLSLAAISVATTFRISLSFLLFFLAELFLGTISLMFINLYAEVGNKRINKELLASYLKVAVVFPILVAILSVPFFVLLPRVQTPLFDIFARKGALKSGIAEEVEIGKVGEIQQDNTVVLRVYGLENLSKDTYWRVSVFDTMEGTRWTTTLERPEPVKFQSGKKAIKYTVVLEPILGAYIPMIDYPITLLHMEGFKREDTHRIEGGVWRARKEIKKPIRYVALSSPSEPYDKASWVHLKVPKGVPKSIRKLAQELGEGRSDTEKLESVKRYFRDNGFKYSLRLDRYTGHPLEYFLFVSKKGNCEFYASTTALLLRLMGIPSRLVGGFKGAVKNEYGDYFIVTNSMAHVWVEAFVGGKWIRVDTTPSYISPAVRKISKIDLIRDSIVSFWYANVVGFSVERQISIIHNLKSGLGTLNLKNLKVFIKEKGDFMLAFLLPPLLIVLYRELRRSPENLYRNMIAKLERKRGAPLRELMPEEILELFKEDASFKNILFITRIYQRHRFSKYGVSKEELREGYRALRNI